MTSLEDQTLEREAEEFAVNFSAVVENVERVIRGKTEVIRLAPEYDPAVGLGHQYEERLEGYYGPAPFGARRTVLKA